MKPLYVFLFSLFISVPLIAYAGPTVSGDFGLTFPKGVLKYDNKSTKTYFGFGGRLGIKLDFELADNFYFQSGVAYVTNGMRTRDNNYVLHTIQVPFDVIFKIDTQHNKGVLMGFGPYLAFNANAGSDYEKRFKSTDLGLSANLGCRLDKLTTLGLRCQLGVSNLFRNTNSNYALASTFNLGFSVGYTFERRGVKNPVSETPQ